jgi:hypothetical protein
MNLLNQRALKQISNNNLKYEIIPLHEKWYNTMKVNDKKLSEDILHIKRNFNQDHFDKFQLFVPKTPNGFIYTGEMIPINVNEIQNNVQYRYFLNSIIASHSAVISLYEFLKVNLQNAIDQIRTEIQALND